jgi:23S rRNA pseudouridine1911/1915/1917 synthase
MRERKILKTYYAEVKGCPEKKEALLEHYLVHEEFHARVVPHTHPAGKKAVLHYRVVKEKNGITSLEITLHTGRYHQIRAQLAAIGVPVLGDHKYGADARQDDAGIALHHGKLEFVHPVTHEKLSIKTS